MSRFVGPLLILLCTVIWGSAFVAQKLGADHFGPVAISCYRNLLAGVFLWGGVRLRERFRRRNSDLLSHSHSTSHSTCLLGGTISGVVLFVAMLTQQLGIERTSPGVSAFLTANYVMIVPILASFLGRRVRLPVWAGAALAIVGTFLICFSAEDLRRETIDLGAGEKWTLLCAVLFAVQIMVVDHFAPCCDMLRFSMVQMFAAGLVALPFVFLPGEMARASWQGFVKGIPAMVYLGIFSSGIAYTLQNLGQARTPPALAAILMSTESVFGALFGWLLLGDLLSSRQVVGCLLVLAAVILSQLLPSGKRCRD